MLNVLVASCNGRKITSGSTDWSEPLMLARAACTASVNSLLFLTSFEAPIVSNAVMTNTLEPTGVDVEKVVDREPDLVPLTSEVLAPFSGCCCSEEPLWWGNGGRSFWRVSTE